MGCVGSPALSPSHTPHTPCPQVQGRGTAPLHPSPPIHHPPPQSAREYEFLKTPAPLSAEPTFRDKFNKEWRARWWLWTALLFALVVFGGLFAFRESLYTQNTGMPLLAGASAGGVLEPIVHVIATVTENAQELCDAKCASEVGVDPEGQAANKEKYEACLALCVKGTSGRNRF